MDGDANAYQFTIIIDRQPEEGYLVTVPALPGCFTEGRTWEEAYEMAADAVRAYCASLPRHGEPIPVDSLEGQFIGRLSVSLDSVMPRLPTVRAEQPDLIRLHVVREEGVVV